MIKPPVIDLSDVLDLVPSSVYWDFVHTNEQGAEIIAAAIEEPLRQALRETNSN